jgi:murein DD-endopeptidase MepM/ murein hydrolase activator NlpD
MATGLPLGLLLAVWLGVALHAAPDSWGQPSGQAAPACAEEPTEALRQRALAFPLPEAYRGPHTNTFGERRGDRPHEAMDIPAPRHTPVRAVDAGMIAKLFVSAAGGLTIYQFDSTACYAFYYAHLEGYAAELAEGQTVHRGQVLGYVGTSGNAPAETPHLHFAIFHLHASQHWWEGTPIDPYPVLK